MAVNLDLVMQEVTRVLQAHNVFGVVLLSEGADKQGRLSVNIPTHSALQAMPSGLVVKVAVAEQEHEATTTALQILRHQSHVVGDHLTEMIVHHGLGRPKVQVLPQVQQDPDALVAEEMN